MRWQGLPTNLQRYVFEVEHETLRNSNVLHFCILAPCRAVCVLDMKSRRMKLECVASFSLFGNVYSMQSVRIAGSPLDSLLLSFKDAKVLPVIFTGPALRISGVRCQNFFCPQWWRLSGQTRGGGWSMSFASCLYMAEWNAVGCHRCPSSFDGCVC